MIIDPYGKYFRWKEINNKKFKYQLIEDYTTRLNISLGKINGKLYSCTDNYLLVKKGYCWDGASGPTLDTINTMRASCIHDVLYQMIRCKQLSLSCKDYADRELQRIMMEDWKPKTRFGEIWNLVRGMYYYWGVRLFGGGSCVPGTQLV